ncbi:MAG TPA: GAF domain-containing protein [Bryobacteraceae bacterium]|nr:GAF domain-containing protein [Bryobacteraceae bacterium]
MTFTSQAAEKHSFVILRLACAAALSWFLLAGPATAQTRLSLEQAGARGGPDFTPAYEGQEAVVSGQVSMRPIVVAGSYYLAIQDQASFGLLIEGAEWRFHGLEAGDWVEAQGTIATRGGHPVLLPQEIHRTSHSKPPAPRPVSAPGLASFRYLGVLVTTEGIVQREDQNAGGDLLLLEKSKGLTVFLPRTRRDSGPQLSGYREGDRIRVSGIASQYCTLPPYDQYFQVLIGSPAAVTVLERGWIIQPPVLLASLILAAALLAIWWFRERRMAALRKQMRLLNALGEEVVRATSPVEILRRLTLSLPALYKASGVGLYIQNRGTKLLESIHSSSEAVQGIDPAAPEGAIAQAVAACFRNRSLLTIPDTRRSPFFGKAESAPRSLLLVPMLSQGDAVGVLELRHGENFHYFSQPEQEAMQHLANQLATALTLQEQHSMREQLFRSEKLAAAGQLISDVAEELRSPLDSIVLQASNLQAGQPGEFNQELESIANEARRASEIVGRLVSFGRVEQAEVAQLDLNAVLSGLLKFRAPEWKVKGVEIQSQLAPKRAMVMGSPGQLEQVLLNLLVDAEKSAAEAPSKTITVSTSLLANRVLLEITYPVRSADSLRADWRDGDSAGSGALGLGVCRGIIQSQGGEFRVVRVSPFQARFDIELPLVEASAGAGSASEFTEAGRQLTVLVVEPDTKVQRQLVQLLGTRGDRVVPVSSAEEGVDIVQRLRFDMVICAVRLPGLNWVEFFERVRRQVGGLVLLSDGFNNDLSRSFPGGEAVVLSKPINEAELQRICRNIEERVTVNN